MDRGSVPRRYERIKNRDCSMKRMMMCVPYQSYRKKILTSPQMVLRIHGG